MRTINRFTAFLLIICILNYLDGCTKNIAVRSSELTHQSRYRITSVHEKDSIILDLPFLAKGEIQDSILILHTNKEMPLQIPVSKIDSIYVMKYSPGRTGKVIFLGALTTLAMIVLIWTIGVLYHNQSI